LKTLLMNFSGQYIFGNSHLKSFIRPV